MSKGSVSAENERLLEEAEERLRRKRAALGIAAPSGSGGQTAPPNPPAKSAEQADQEKEKRFTQDTQDSKEPLDFEDIQREAAEAAGAAGLEEEFGDEVDDDAEVPDLTLPLDRYVEEAGKAEVEWMEQQASEATGSVDWKAGWHFVRLMKCHPDLRELKTLDALRTARAAIERAAKRRPIYRRLPGVAFNEVIGGFLAESTDEFDAHFIRNWKAIRHLPGESPLDAAVRLANLHPLATLATKDGSLPQYRKLVSIAGWLQYVMREKNIFLPVRTLGPLVGCSPRSISSYIAQAEEEEVLERVKAHALTTRKAHEFRFQTDRWPILRDGPP